MPSCSTWNTGGERDTHIRPHQTGKVLETKPSIHAYVLGVDVNVMADDDDVATGQLLSFLLGQINGKTREKNFVLKKIPPSVATSVLLCCQRDVRDIPKRDVLRLMSEGGTFPGL